MTLNNNFPAAPLNVSVTESYLKKILTTINNTLRGKLNCTGEVTLTASASSTVVLDNNCNENSAIVLTPVTSNAAKHTNDLYIMAGDKQFTIHHNSSAHTDKVMRYVLIG